MKSMLMALLVSTTVQAGTLTVTIPEASKTDSAKAQEFLRELTRRKIEAKLKFMTEDGKRVSADEAKMLQLQGKRVFRAPVEIEFDATKGATGSIRNK